MPLISVILPSFNRTALLAQSVASVQAQTVDDWELIIADDGSDAATRDWLAERRDARIRVLLLARSGSPAAARNAAMAMARGRYLAFLDSDDLWMPRKLELQLATLRARRDCRWSYTAFRRVDLQGAVLAAETGRRWVAADGWIFDDLLRGRASLRTPAVMADRELVLRAGGFDAAILACEDFDLWLRLALESPVCVVDQPLVDVRVVPGSYSEQWPHALEYRGLALDKVYARASRALRARVRAERARNSAALAGEYGQRGRRAEARRESWKCLACAWRHPSTWPAALRALSVAVSA